MSLSKGSLSKGSSSKGSSNNGSSDGEAPNNGSSDNPSSNGGSSNKGSLLDRVLILGAKGQLGSALVKQKWPVGTFVLPATRDQLDITNPTAVRAYIERWRPRLVINAAGYTAVDAAEDDPARAIAANHRAVTAIVDALRPIGGRLIQISTDYVFDGATKGWYTEHDQVNPLSTYGRSKRAGELAALELNDSLVVRTSWLYSSTGHNFVRTIRDLGRRRSELDVVDDQQGCPTSADELAAGLISAIEAGLKYTGVFHLAAPDSATWWQLADEVLRLDGRRDQVTLNRVTTEQFPRPARRPADSRISSDAFATAYGVVLSPWRQALAEVSRQLDRQDLDLRQAAVPVGVGGEIQDGRTER